MDTEKLKQVSNHHNLDSLCIRSPFAKMLREELNDIQSRLGGTFELPHDQKTATALAHQLNNLLCAVELLNDAKAKTLCKKQEERKHGID